MTAEVTRWAEGYRPRGQQEVYEIIAKYSEKQYDTILNHFDTADKKTDELIRFMAGFVGAVTTLVATKLVKFEHPWFTILSLLPIAIAFLAAIRARSPINTIGSMSPRSLLEVADYHAQPTKHEIESTIAVSYHVTIVGMNEIIQWKSRLNRLALTCFLAGVAIFLLALMPF